MLLSATSDAGACHVIHSCAEEDISWKTKLLAVAAGKIVNILLMSHAAIPIAVLNLFTWPFDAMGMGASVRREPKPAAQELARDQSGQADSGIHQQPDEPPVADKPAAAEAEKETGVQTSTASPAPEPQEVVQVAPEPAVSAEPAAGAGAAASSALAKAVEAENWAEAEQLLNERPEECDVNARTADWNYSLLRASAEEGAESVCRLLLAKQADVNARDQNNMTPLMGCVVGGDFSGIVSLLLEARADAAAVTDDGFTALKWATRLNREATIALLRDAGMTGEDSAFA
ncbi:CTTNBP2 [Symbiodinium necroappetens]|uniref:CTTNBP2 protein n=1 Tax=Symbiodinium necroappetens TaxID=1628268 RepID=A0A812K7E8_9DINO|nr:CTTNBP2 [Symbiodinium necroappetens]